MLDSYQFQRYSRHILLDEVGIAGQRRLLDAKVAIVGAGGLGSPAGIYLAAAGVGTIGVIDADVVDVTNLQRQVLHQSSDLGRPKTESAREHLQQLNPDVCVVEHRELLTAANAMEILAGYDVIINGSDNFPTRYLVNDACILLDKPLVDASILKFEGQVTVYSREHGCYRCLFPTPPPPGMVPSCSEAGIIGALAGHMGTLQAVEAIKLILNIGEPLTNRLLIYDALAADYHTVAWQRNRNCPLCGDRPTIDSLVDYEQFCGMPFPQVGAPAEQRLSLANLNAQRAADVDVNQIADLVTSGQLPVIDVREPHEFAQFRIDGAKLIPMAELGRRLTEINLEKPTLFVCAVGGRSAAAVEFLRRHGFRLAFNLKGGMIAWLTENQPTVAG